MTRAGDIKVTEQAAGWWTEAKSNKYFRFGLVAAAFIAVLDQLTKYLIVHVVELPVKQKIEISGIFDLTYVQNYGASFGMLSENDLIAVTAFGIASGAAIIAASILFGFFEKYRVPLIIFAILTGLAGGYYAGGMASRLLLTLISISVAVGLAYWLGRLHRPVAAAGVAMIIGGALGNLYDRLAYGYVVDFLDFSGLWFPWVFNVADASINVGVALLLLDAWQTRERPDASKPSKNG